MSRTSALTPFRTGTPSYSRLTFSILSRVMPRLYLVSHILLALQGQCCVRAKQALRESDAIVLHKAQSENRKLNCEHSRKAEVVILIEKDRPDPTFGSNDTFNHGQHHPADSGVLPKDVESFVDLPKHDDFPDHEPCAQPKWTRE